MWQRYRKSFVILLFVLTGACADPASRAVRLGDCPTPDEPYLHPEACADKIDLPFVTDLVFDPPGGKVPQRVRFVADARAGIFELEKGLEIHWDLDGDGTEDTVTVPGETFYFHYETCETVLFHVWATDSLNRIGRVLKKSLTFFCNKPPVISLFNLPVDYGAPGQTFQFQVDAYDPDALDGSLLGGIDRIDWDFDGDGAYEGRTDGIPVLLDLKHTYTEVGIFRPRIRVYDEDGDYAESKRLQLSVLGTSQLVNAVVVKTDADALIASGTTVASFEGGGITIRELEGQRMVEKVQQTLGTSPTLGVAHAGNVYFTSVQNDGLNLLVWLVRTEPDGRRTARLLKNCLGVLDHLNYFTGAPGGFFGRRAGKVLVSSFVDTLGAPVTAAIVLQYNESASKGLLYALDLRKLNQMPVTNNTGSSCPPSGAGIVSQEKELHLDPDFGRRFSPLAATSDDRYLWVANGDDGIRVLDMDQYWVGGNSMPLTYHLSSGYSASWMAGSVETRRASWASTAPVLSSVDATAAVLETDDWLDSSAPVTVTADGWPLPASTVSGYGYAVSISVSAWNGFGLSVSSIVVQYHRASLLLVGSLTTNAVRLYERLYSPAPSLKLLKEVSGITYQGRAEPGRLLFAGKWMAQFVQGTAGASGVYFRSLTDPSILAPISGYAYAKVEDIAWDGRQLWIAQGDRGVAAAKPPAETRKSRVVTLDPLLGYQPGGKPGSIGIDLLANRLWVAEGRGGLHSFLINANDAPQSETRYTLSATPLDLAVDAVSRSLYVAEGTMVARVDLDSAQETSIASGMNSASCIDFRRDGTLLSLAWCSAGSPLPQSELRYSTGGGFAGVSGILFDTMLGTRGLLGPQDVDRPRYFVMDEGGLGIFCPQEGGVCSGDPWLLSGSKQQDPVAASYRYQNLDLMVVGGKNGRLSFWNFTGTPAELGSTYMCDPFEQWLPANICGKSFDIRDIDVAGPYAFLGTTNGVFVVDLRAAPILRVGSFYTGIRIDRIVARYKSGSAYVAYGANDTSMYTFRFTKLKAPE